VAYSGPYGSVAGVEGLTRHIRYGGGENHPRLADVEDWLTARAAQLTGWIAAAGYVTPVLIASYPEAVAVLGRFANYGAASDAEAAQRTGGYSSDDEDRREVWFAREFNKAESWINGGALAGLGVPTLPTPGASAGLQFIPVVYRDTSSTDEFSR